MNLSIFALSPMAKGRSSSSSSNLRCSILLLLLLAVLMLSKFAIRSSHATPTLFPNQTVYDGQSMISANKTYELGFFSPSGSTNRYVGIWYHNLPVHTVVWVANRENPISDTSGYIAFDSQGNLLILDSTGSFIVIAPSDGTTNLTAATLLDSGNFVLREWISTGNGQVLWQSFDNPTDTFLPGMQLGLNGKKNRLLTSWRSPQDPGAGEFSLGADPSGTKQFLIWRRGKIYWTSGIYRQNFSLASRTLDFYLHDIDRKGNWSGEVDTTFLNDESNMSTRLVMDIDGRIKRLVWVKDANEWIFFQALPVSFSCEDRYYCGANGLCNNYTSPPCICLFGFEPTATEDWGGGIWKDGCKRVLPPNCRRRDGFWRQRNVKLPLFYVNTGNSSAGLEDCKAECLSNCSCTACASANGNGTGCLLWYGELLGLQESSGGAQDIHVRVAASELFQDSDHKWRSIVPILIPVAAVVMVLLLCALVCLFCWRKHQAKRAGEEGSDCSLFSFPVIAAATNNFSSSNKLGEGGFGPVYKAILEGQTVAVKRLSTSSGQGVEEFKNEIALISKLQHTNLVRLLGYCIQREEKMLIYEYMPNKSLDSYIFDPIKRAQLDWLKRFHIIEGIAQGLLYLHKYSRLRIVHRDLKASNILLDSEMNPKISDFGMARIFGRDENQANTRRVVGTYGYMSPEYAIGGLFSVKSDVFSFGVLLLEIVSGKKITSFQHSESSPYLLGYAWQLWRDGRGLELADPSMGNIQSPQEVSRSIQVGLLCVQDSAADRPSMSVVVSMLSSEETVLPTPKQPAFFPARRAAESDTNSQGIPTPNNVTLTSIEGR